MEPEELHDDQFNQIQGLMRIQQTNKFWRAAHKEAKLCLGASSTIVDTDVMTLFDTGASSRNHHPISTAYMIN